MINYMKLIELNHPTVEASCNGDTSVYANLTFHIGTVTEAALDAEYLDYHKAEKKLQIDIKTKELIESGIVYDSVVFSSSETAQRNWLALDQFKAFHTYPVAVTADDDSEYSFADAAAVEAFVLTGMGTINAHYASGRALKVQVNAATDIAGVDAVIDNR